MILNVSSTEFISAVKRHSHDTGVSGQQAIYFYQFPLPQGGDGYRLTFAVPQHNILIVTDMLVEAKAAFVLTGGQAPRTGDEAFDELVDAARSAGMALAPGIWTDRPEPTGEAQQTAGAGEGAPGRFFIGAVSFLTADGEAGVWVDAYPNRPSEQQVLRAMYDDFVRSGDLAGTSYDDFVNGSQPTVEVLSHDDVANWMSQKQ